MMKLFLLFIAGSFGVCCNAQESITNIRRNVVNVKDGSSEVNSGVDLGKSDVKTVVGNGRVVSRKIKVEAFSILKATGSFRLEVKCGSTKPEIVVKADSNLIGLIDFKVKDGILNIAFTRPVSTGNPVKISVATDLFSAIELSGSSDAKISNLKSEKFKLFSTGSCRVDLSGGGVKELHATLEGACSVNASKLISVDNFIRLGGSSEAYIRSDGSINVSADGASELKYIGNPKIEQHLSGAASISKG